MSIKRFSRFLLGSTCIHKRNAVKQALDECGISHDEISCFHVDSGVNEQPVGLEEIQKGAYNRATRVLSLIDLCEQNNFIGIGIESGIVRVKNVVLDMAIVAINIPYYEVYYATSAGIEFSLKYVAEAERLGFEKTTVGSIIAKHLGGDGTDSHAILTGGVVKRNDTIVSALKIVFSQKLLTLKQGD
jgi:non-canonical (house-cleaning) NTP pyrophosphatase